MSYTDRPGYNQPGGYGEPGYSAADGTQVVDYHDRVRWGPILGGLVTAISLQLVLSALGAAIGLSTLSASGTPRADAGDVGIGVGIWTILSVLISLFLGGYATARACGPMSRSSALINGAILWSTTLAVSTWLLASGVSGAFGLLLSTAGDVAGQVAQPGGVGLPTNAPDPNVTQGQITNTAGNAARANWWFALGCLLSLLAAIAGATAGTRKLRNGSART